MAFRTEIIVLVCAAALFQTAASRTVGNRSDVFTYDSDGGNDNGASAIRATVAYAANSRSGDQGEGGPKSRSAEEKKIRSRFNLRKYHCAGVCVSVSIVM